MLYSDFKFLRGSDRKDLIELIQECMFTSKSTEERTEIQDRILEDLLNSLEMKLLEDDEFPENY